MARADHGAYLLRRHPEAGEFRAAWAAALDLGIQRIEDCALERVLTTLRPITSGRIIVVFGAGGDRDRGKRPLMGAVAEAHADLAVVTSDNPRTEDPDAIIDDIEKGMSAPHVRITDRTDAIAHALGVAGPEDVIVLAGKGHETYQIIGQEKRSFDERAVVANLLRGAA